MKMVYGFKSRVTALAVLLLLLIPLFAFPSYAAESGDCGSGLKWTLSGGTLTVSGSGAMNDWNDGEYAPWYEHRDSITAVVFSSGITHIGAQSFFDCGRIRAVSMPRSVTSVGSYAFAECAGITTVTTSDILQVIGEGAFTECTSLSNIRFPSTLKTIGSKAFYRCYSLKSVTIPASVEELGAQAFAYCEGLIRVTVNAKIDSLPAWSFYGCESLVSVSLSDTIKDTGSESFTGCSSLQSVYTQTYDINEAENIKGQIEKDVPSFSDNGYVAPYDQPQSMSYTQTETQEGSGASQTAVTTTIYETENSVITVSQTATYNGEGAGDIKTVVEASVSGDAGWTEVIKQINEETLGDGTPQGKRQVEAKINMAGTTVTAEALKQMAGSSADITVITSDGISWTFDTQDLAKLSLDELYDLSIEFQRNDEDRVRLEAEAAYTFRFKGAVNFPITVGVPLSGQALNAATLFLPDSTERLMTMLVDKEDNAWFSFEYVENDDEYKVGINVLDTKQKDVVIPKTMLTGDYEGLIDENGVRYEITGRSSKWGITGGQFALFVGAGILAIVLVVAIIMITRNHSLKMKNEAMRRQEEKDKREQKIDKDELYDEVLRDMLKDKDKADNGKK
ncbi:MAG: leucine-rich repeat domain-containing protein [Clostridia bacterium]|nr:leucine-rich repeat domain-containing protein [Clostridia bacterium]